MLVGNGLWDFSRLYTLWAQVSPVDDAGFEESDDVMDCESW